MYSDSDKLGNNSTDVESVVRPNVDRQEEFDKFLTYRRRMARAAASQILAMADNKNLLYIDPGAKEIHDIFTEVIYFYRNVVFSPKEYGWNRKNKKVDEICVYVLITGVMRNLEKIDDIIAGSLNTNWTVAKLDPTLRAILRCAVYEVLNQEVKHAIVTSEYTTLAARFLSNKSVGFVNAVLDNICKKHKAQTKATEE